MKFPEDQAFLFGGDIAWECGVLGNKKIQAQSFLKWTNKASTIIFIFKTRRNKVSSLLYYLWHLNLSTFPNSRVCVSSTGVTSECSCCALTKVAKGIRLSAYGSSMSHYWWFKGKDATACSLFSGAGQPLSGLMCTRRNWASFILISVNIATLSWVTFERELWSVLGCGEDYPSLWPILVATPSLSTVNYISKDYFITQMPTRAFGNKKGQLLSQFLGIQ